jgi:hypothetical protein
VHIFYAKNIKAAQNSHRNVLGNQQSPLAGIYDSGLSTANPLDGPLRKAAVPVPTAARLPSPPTQMSWCLRRRGSSVRGNGVGG